MKVSAPSAGHLRRFLRLSSGFLLLPLGVVMLILPGPGLPILLLALGLLASDFLWAKRLLGWVQKQLGRAAQLVPPRFTRRRSTQISQKEPPDRPLSAEKSPSRPIQGGER